MKKPMLQPKITISWFVKLDDRLISLVDSEFSEESVCQAFRWGLKSIELAETAASAERAEDILADHYLGNVGWGGDFRWVISEETYISWIQNDLV